MPSHSLRIAYSRIAVQDIESILAYSARTWGDDQRIRYRSQLRDTIRRLASMPALGRERDECAPGIRSYPVNSHLVFYLQRDEILYVVRVLHSRQDPDAVDWEEAMIGSD